MFILVLIIYDYQQVKHSGDPGSNPSVDEIWSEISFTLFATKPKSFRRSLALELEPILGPGALGLSPSN